MAGSHIESEQQRRQDLDFLPPEHYDYDQMLSAVGFRLSEQEQEYLLEAIRFSSDWMSPAVERPAENKLGQRTAKPPGTSLPDAASRAHMVDTVNGDDATQNQVVVFDCGLDENKLLFGGLRITAQEGELLKHTFHADRSMANSLASRKRTEHQGVVGGRKEMRRGTTPSRSLAAKEKSVM